MDTLFIAVIVLSLFSLGSWGYGTYCGPVPGGRFDHAGPDGWVNPVGLFGLLVMTAMVLVLVSGWRPGLW
jgi:hypothetical protein